MLRNWPADKPNLLRGKYPTCSEELVTATINYVRNISKLLGGFVYCVLWVCVLFSRLNRQQTIN